MPAAARALALRKSFILICPRNFLPGRRKTHWLKRRRLKNANTGAPMRLAEVENQNVANKLFDMGVNMGVRQAAVYAQRAVNPSHGRQLTEDGNIGPKTLAAINAH